MDEKFLHTSKIGIKAMDEKLQELVGKDVSVGWDRHAIWGGYLCIESESQPRIYYIETKNIRISFVAKDVSSFSQKRQTIWLKDI